MNDSAQEAILAALSSDWNKAISLNTKILALDTQNIDALNRLARAYAEIGKNNLAKKATNQVLKIDPSNTIALKALEKWKVLKSGKSFSSRSGSPDSFLEEPGKTKVVTLMHVGDQNILAKLDSADEVKLDNHSHRVNVVTLDGKYIGRLPDDLSAKIKKLISLGNIYQTFIKSADKNEVKVIIREVERSPKLANTPSFSTEKIDYVSFTPPELVHEKRDMDMNITEEGD